ncbi:glycosyl transferase family 1 [Micromonospora sp. Llam7]|nr:glycosyl transferase family 1 [Micromonospora tarapacensis]
MVGHTPFHYGTGTALTMSNLFSGWPKDRLAQIYTANITPSRDVCELYFHLPPRDRYLPVQYHSMRLLGWNGNTSPQQSRAVSAICAGAERRPTLARMYANMKAIDDVSPVRITQALTRWARAFDPELVYSVSGSARHMRIAAATARACGVPLVPHFTDDWPATLYTNGELLGLARRVVRQETHRLIRLAPLGMVISRPMAQEYSRRYGIPFSVFTNCVDESFFASPRYGADPPDGSLELVYVGALHLNRWKSLRDIGEALGVMAEGGLPARLTVHSPASDLARYGKYLTDLKWIRLGAPLASHEVPAALRSATVLVHVESFDEEVRRYTRYSVSTKIPQYLATGRPILGYGPTEVASMNHIREADAGVVVGKNNARALVDALTDLCRDAALRWRLAHNGLAFARREHTRENVAARFAATLRSAVTAGVATSDVASSPTANYPVNK